MKQKDKDDYIKQLEKANETLSDKVEELHNAIDAATKTMLILSTDITQRNEKIAFLTLAVEYSISIVVAERFKQYHDDNAFDNLSKNQKNEIRENIKQLIGQSFNRTAGIFSGDPIKIKKLNWFIHHIVVDGVAKMLKRKGGV